MIYKTHILCREQELRGQTELLSPRYKQNCKLCHRWDVRKEKTAENLIVKTGLINRLSWSKRGELRHFYRYYLTDSSSSRWWLGWFISIPVIISVQCQPIMTGEWQNWITVTWSVRTLTLFTYTDKLIRYHYTQMCFTNRTIINHSIIAPSITPTMDQ